MAVPGAGALRHKVGFYKKSTSSDGYGNTRGSWSGAAEFTVAAAIKPKLGGEQVTAVRLEGRNLANITVRRSAQTATVTPDWRVKDERSGVIYAIRSIIDPNADNSRRGQFLEMLCEQGAAP